MNLVLSGRTIASCDGDSARWTGELKVARGEETAHIAVQFVDHGGDAVSLDGDGYLEVETTDDSIAEFERTFPESSAVISTGQLTVRRRRCSA